MTIIPKLRQSEREAIIEGLAMMTYNPSIGRVLEKGGVDKFRDLMIEKTRRLEEIKSEAEFDDFHDSIVETIKKEFKTTKGESLSYGQAQKPLNVFLKVYVDWAGQPCLEKVNQLRKFLHVPLDSILMKEIKAHFPDEYKKYVVTTYDSVRNNFKKHKEIDESVLRKMIDSSNFSLQRMIFKEMYYAWQQCARAIHPEKPILLDVLWSLKRKVKFISSNLFYKESYKMTTSLENQFHEAMRSIYYRALDECGYKATHFLRLVNERGGLEAAKFLLHKELSEGFIKLWELGRLDLTMEAMILEPKWKELFTEEEREIAKKRLNIHMLCSQ